MTYWLIGRIKYLSEENMRESSTYLMTDSISDIEWCDDQASILQKFTSIRQYLPYQMNHMLG